jgi:hypothetical protein
MNLNARKVLSTHERHLHRRRLWAGRVGTTGRGRTTGVVERPTGLRIGSRPREKRVHLTTWWCPSVCAVADRDGLSSRRKPKTAFWQVRCHPSCSLRRLRSWVRDPPPPGHVGHRGVTCPCQGHAKTFRAGCAPLRARDVSLDGSPKAVVTRGPRRAASDHAPLVRTSPTKKNFREPRCTFRILLLPASPAVPSSLCRTRMQHLPRPTSHSREPLARL